MAVDATDRRYGAVTPVPAYALNVVAIRIAAMNKPT
jgi:hypothetical protein